MLLHSRRILSAAATASNPALMSFSLGSPTLAEAPATEPAASAKLRTAVVIIRMLVSFYPSEPGPRNTLGRLGDRWWSPALLCNNTGGFPPICVNTLPFVAGAPEHEISIVGHDTRGRVIGSGIPRDGRVAEKLDAVIGSFIAARLTRAVDTLIDTAHGHDEIMPLADLFCLGRVIVPVKAHPLTGFRAPGGDQCARHGQYEAGLSEHSGRPFLRMPR